MNQVSDTVVFAVDPPPPSGSVYSYVWTWWDGSTDTTAVPWVRKTLNQGGDPFTTGDRELFYSCTPVAPDGQHRRLDAFILVNNRPVVVSPVRISVNDAYFPYTTEIKVRAYDYDNAAIPLQFKWYENGAELGSSGTTVAGDPINVVWRGNGVELPSSRPTWVNTLSGNVASHRSLELRISDADGGVASISVELRGSKPPDAVLGGASAGALSGQVSAMARVGPGASVDFEVYAKNPSGSGAVNFSWNFAGSNGWTVPSGPLPGTTSATADGGYKSVQSRDISAEAFPAGGRKSVVGTATVAWSGGHDEIRIPLTLVANAAPAGVVVSVRTGSEDYVWDSGLPIVSGTTVEFLAQANDPDLDLTTYAWTIVQPPGALPPATLRLWGARVFLDTTGWPAGSKIQATVVATDRFLAQASATTPAISVTV